jgi:hypothetical protein
MLGDDRAEDRDKGDQAGHSHQISDERRPLRLDRPSRHSRKDFCCHAIYSVLKRLHRLAVRRRLPRCMESPAVAGRALGGRIALSPVGIDPAIDLSGNDARPTRLTVVIFTRVCTTWQRLRCCAPPLLSRQRFEDQFLVESHDAALAGEAERTFARSAFAEKGSGCRQSIKFGPDIIDRGLNERTCTGHLKSSIKKLVERWSDGGDGARQRFSRFRR